MVTHHLKETEPSGPSPEPIVNLRLVELDSAKPRAAVTAPFANFPPVVSETDTPRSLANTKLPVSDSNWMLVTKAGATPALRKSNSDPLTRLGNPGRFRSLAT